jgi:hypothetical protein
VIRTNIWVFQDFAQVIQFESSLLDSDSVLFPLLHTSWTFARGLFPFPSDQDSTGVRTDSECELSFPSRYFLLGFTNRTCYHHNLRNKTQNQPCSEVLVLIKNKCYSIGLKFPILGVI